MQFTKPIPKGAENDPYMINPKGARVMVPASRVPELLSKGFILEDKLWQPLEEERIEEKTLRDFPIPRKELLQEAQKKIDSLDVWEV